jgi:hypothetical protein
MKTILTNGKNGRALAASAGLAMCAAMVFASDIDSAFSQWLGREITIDTATTSEQMPAGGKMTLVYDGKDDVVRLCTRTAPDQKQPWQQDLAAGCNVALTFTEGKRYCTVEDVKAGDGEVLSSCHRLRSSDVALSSSGAKDGVEHGDVIVFLLSPERGENAVAVLIDSPARVTNDVIVIGKF